MQKQHGSREIKLLVPTHETTSLLRSRLKCGQRQFADGGKKSESQTDRVFHSHLSSIRALRLEARRKEKAPTVNEECCSHRGAKLCQAVHYLI